MNSDRITVQPCIVQPPPPPDPRCADAAFALAHPEICAAGALILKPGLVTACALGSVQFRLFEYLSGSETEIDGRFTSSDDTVFTIGVNSGNGTALASGTAIITATATDGRSVTAQVIVPAGDNCCESIRVLTALVLDTSKSMSLSFSGTYGTRLQYAKVVANTWGGSIMEVNGVPKDADRVWTVNETVAAVSSAFEDDSDVVLADIAAASQTLLKTNLSEVFSTITNDLLLNTGDRRVVLLIGDGEHTVDTNIPAIRDAAAAFKNAGGIVVAVGIRASGAGYDFLERVATGGFFLNATADNADDVLSRLHYLKSLLCAGVCVPEGDTFVNVPELEHQFINWETVDGVVNLLGPGLLDVQPGHGLYLEFGSLSKATIRSIDTFPIVSGSTYRITFDAAGNQRSETAAQGIRVSVRAATTDFVLYENTVYPAWDDEFQTYNLTFIAPYDADVRLYFEQMFAGSDVAGTLLDDVLFRNETTLSTLLEDSFDDENLTYIPPACGASAEVADIADPGAPAVEQTANVGDSLFTFYKYTYGYSWVTNEGETLVTPVVFTPTEVEKSGAIRRIDFDTAPPARATKVRVWRSLGEIHTITLAGAGVADVNGVYTRVSQTRWEKSATIFLEFDEASNIWRSWNDGDSNYSCQVQYFPLNPWEYEGLDETPPTASITYEAAAVVGAMFMLAELPIYETSYFDNEGRDDFEARYESSVTAPTVNSTEIDPGGMGYGYASCCYYYTVEEGTTGEFDLILVGDSGSNPSVTPTDRSNNPANEWPVSGGRYFPFDGFGGTASHYWAGDIDDSIDPGSGILPYLQVQFPSAVLISSYRLAGITGGALSAPKSWVMAGSNDGTTWTTLDSQSGVTGWTDDVPKTFPVITATAYAYYRITVSEVDGAATTATIALWQMHGCGTALQRTQTMWGNSQVGDAPVIPDELGGAALITTSGGGIDDSAAYRAFDRDATQGWQAHGVLDASGNFTIPIWIAYQFSTPAIIGSYTLQSATHPDDLENGISDFYLQGSNDGLAWTTLDTQQGLSWGDGETKTFTIATPAAYLIYRLVATAPEYNTGEGETKRIDIMEITLLSTCLPGSRLEFENRCPVCLSGTPGVQLPDSPALPDIETGVTPPVVSCTKTVQVPCPVGTKNVTEENLVPLMTSATEPEGQVIVGNGSGSGPAAGFEAWKAFDQNAATFMQLVGTITGYIGYRFETPQIITRYAITIAPTANVGSPHSFTFQGSNNGTTWVTLDTRGVLPSPSISWNFVGQRKEFSFSNSTAYSYYRLNIVNTTGNISNNMCVAELEMFGVAVTYAEGTATAQASTYEEACRLATIAATAAAQLNCVTEYSATASATTTPCPVGQYGGTPITASATRTSLNSYEEALAAATAAAQELADVGRTCSLSNNEQKIVINDNTVASPYPSVKHVSGFEGVIGKVTVTLCGLSHASPDDLELLLVSPSGTKVKLWQNAGGTTPIVSATIILDDDAATALPDGTAIVAGSYRPACYSPITALQMLSPAPALPYELTLAAFIGEDPNGSWALWIFDDLALGSGELSCGWDLTIT